MLRRPFLVLLGLALFATACGSDIKKMNFKNPFSQLKNVEDGNDVIQEVAKSVVKLEHGTGFFISRNGYLMTNEHVLGRKTCLQSGCYQTLTYNYQKGSSSYIILKAFLKPIYVDMVLDIAIFQVHDTEDGVKVKDPIESSNFLKFSHTKPKIGDEITNVGHPALGLKKFSTGKIYRTMDSWFSAEIFSLGGSSGSPYVDANGKVVGILHHGYDSVDAISRKQFNQQTTGTFATNILQKIVTTNDLITLRDSSKDAVKKVLFEATNFGSADEETWMKSRPAYFAAHVLPKGKAFGFKDDQTLVDVLIEKCKAELDSDKVVDIDDRAEDIRASCMAISPWLECAKKEQQGFKYCPDEKKQGVLRELTLKAYFKLKSINSYHSSLSYVLSLEESLAKTADESIAAKNSKFEELSSGLQFNIPNIFQRIATLEYVEDTTFKGIYLPAYLVNYKKQSISPAYLGFIPSLAIKLYRFDKTQMPWEDVESIFKSVMKNPDLSLDSYISLEAEAFEMGLL